MLPIWVCLLWEKSCQPARHRSNTGPTLGQHWATTGPTPDQETVARLAEVWTRCKGRYMALKLQRRESCNGEQRREDTMVAQDRRVAIVTGSARGIGRACALSLAERGCAL